MNADSTDRNPKTEPLPGDRWKMGQFMHRVEAVHESGAVTVRTKKTRNRRRAGDFGWALTRRMDRQSFRKTLETAVYQEPEP